MTAKRKKRRKQVRLGRLRTTVRRVNTIYGLMVQAVEALRQTVQIDHEKRFLAIEKRLGLKWSHSDDEYVE